MKHTTILSLLFTVVLWGCSESSTTSKGGSSKDQYAACAGNAYWTTAPCGGYCLNNPSASGCSTTTTGGVSGGTTTSGSTTGGQSYGGITSDNSWTALYNATGKPTVPPVSGCSVSGTGYDTRKGTITMAFQKDTTGPVDDYSPALPGLSSYSANISSFLTNTNDAKMFIESDGQLKVRLMARPQPKPSAGSIYCYGRKTGSGSGTEYGYTQLSYSVSVRAVDANGNLGPHQGTRYLTTNINTCSPALDFSGIAQSSPNGIVLVVHDVSSNQGCSYYPCPSSWSQTTTTCWQTDVEVAVDGTKTF